MLNQLLLREFYAQTYEPLALRSRRKNTKRLYGNTLNSFEKFLERPALMSDLNDATVSRFAAYRVDLGRSKYTVNRDLFNLLAIWRWAHKKAYVTNWPDVAMEKPPTKAPVALLREEIDALLLAIHQEREPVGHYKGNEFWHALFLLTWDTGERIGAVMALEWPQVDLRKRWVRFDADHRKGGAADNQLPIAVDTAAALGKLKPFEGKVFCWPYGGTYLYRRYNKILERAGLPTSRVYKFHCIRKSTASHYEAAGGNATELLGHSTRKITRAYLDVRIIKPQSAVDILFRPGSQSPRP
jgi:integrase